MAVMTQNMLVSNILSKWIHINHYRELMDSDLKNAELEDSLCIQSRDFVNKEAINVFGGESLAKAS